MPARRLFPRSGIVVGVLAAAVTMGESSAAQVAALPSPLTADEVASVAEQARGEVSAARARAAGAAERPRIVSVLPDPMVMASIDHLPFALDGVNASLQVQQDFPFSRVLSHQRRAAEAQAARAATDIDRMRLDVGFEAVRAFYMLAELRGREPILEEQIEIVRQLAGLSREHYAAGQGMQADVQRLDNEAARMQADRAALVAEARGAEAMLDAALARPAAAPVPPLAWSAEDHDPPPLDALLKRAALRPELRGLHAEHASAEAQVDVMKSDYSPMGFVRAGPTYNMLEGAGVMFMVGFTVPVWREKRAAGVREAESMVTSSSAEIGATERMIDGEVAAAREAVGAERARLRALREDIIPRAREVVKSTTAAFGAGQATFLAVLDAARDLRDVRMEELMAEVRLGVAWARLRRATGDLGVAP
jgi:outer membrane protein TolC